MESLQAMCGCFTDGINFLKLLNLEDGVADVFQCKNNERPPCAVIEKGFESTYYDSDMNTR